MAAGAGSGDVVYHLYTLERQTSLRILEVENSRRNCLAAILLFLLHAVVLDAKAPSAGVLNAGIESVILTVFEVSTLQTLVENLQLPQSYRY